MERKKTYREELEISGVRIEVSDLLDILTRLSGEELKVIAETSSLVFNDLEEMRSHRAEFSRAPRIKIGDVTLDMRNEPSPIRLTVDLGHLRAHDREEEAEAALALMQSLIGELSQFKSPLARTGTQALIGFACGVPSFLLAYWFPLSTEMRWLAPAIGSMMCFAITLLVWSLVGKAIGRETVYFRPKDTWIKRHGSEMVSGAIGTAIGALISALVTLSLD